MKDQTSKTFQEITSYLHNDNKFPFIVGPCAIESEKQLSKIARFIVDSGIKFLRAGAYKPRTSPYDFQGLGIDGLKILKNIKEKYDLITVSEIMDPRDIEIGIEYIDVIQVGSRNMYNYSLLKELGKTNHPVLLKRGFMATVKEFLNAAEYIISNGNDNVILCERGIRSYDNDTRNLLDLSCVAIVKETCHLPIIVDLSHSIGRKDITSRLLKAVYAIGADGVMLEIHNNPDQAKSDAYQQMDFDEFTNLLDSFNIFVSGN